LEWHYNTPTRQPDQTSVGRDILLPAAEDLRTLQNLAQDGFVTGIEQFLTNIRQADEAYQPFIEHVSRLANNFEFEEIVSWVDQFVAGRNK
jgi:hypothetical protein